MTTACENGMRELTIDELDAVAGGTGGQVVEAAGQIVNGVIHAVASTVAKFINAAHNTVSC